MTPPAGLGVRIGVIDSGVFPRHPHIGAIAGGAAVHPDGDISEAPEAWIDRLGHGTAVTAAIQEKAPASDLYAVKVFDSALRTSAATLVRAIDWCVAQRFDVVNLSLGSTNPAHAAVFADAAARAAGAGVLLVAARQAGDDLCFPGCLPGVMGVGLDWNIPRDRCDLRAEDGGMVCYASGYPRPVPGVSPSRNLSGVSFAVANMTGLVAAALGQVRGAGRLGLAELQDLLRRQPVSGSVSG